MKGSSVTETSHTGNAVHFKHEGSYIGSVRSAQEACARLQEILKRGAVATADLDGIAVLTAGYADACFGELLAAVGEKVFRDSVVVRNANDSCRFVIEAVLDRRMPGAGPARKRVSVKPLPPKVAIKPKATKAPKVAKFDEVDEENDDEALAAAGEEE